MTDVTQLEFSGSAEQQALAQRIWTIMIGQGSLHGRDALIRQSLDNLAAYIAEQDKADAASLRAGIDEAIRANPAVFSREERGETVLVTTSRSGSAQGRQPDRRHTFAQRLYEPTRPLPVDDINNIVTMIRPPLTTVEPVQISNYWRALANQPIQPNVVVPSAQVEAEPVELAEVAEPAAPEQISAGPVQPTQPAPAPSSGTTIVMSDGVGVDFKQPADVLFQQFGAALKAEVAAAIAEDPLRRVVSFGTMYYPSDALPNFGKNDLRRIRDYIVEQGEPMPDVAILSDVYRERPGTNTFEIFRFGLNYRLSREKDYEYVGTEGLNLWSAKGLTAIGTKRVKASDLGQLYSFFTEGYDETTPTDDGMINHYLSVFEWEYGVLPLNAAFASIMPQPYLHDQRSVVLRFESPQHYTTYVAEVRYPTGNRGGWIWGLEDFFREYLVPGTLITVSATEEPNVFSIAYEEIGGVEDKLLHFEEKRNRFVFLPITYYAAVDEDLLPSQKRYNKLRNLKALPMNERKKADSVVEHVFETIGEQLGTREEPMFWIQLSELLLGINVLRPMSQTYLEHVLGQNTAYYADEATAGAWYYKPVPVEVGATTAAATEADEFDDDE